MHETAKGIVYNLISLINKYGHVLNGASSYYNNRRLLMEEYEVTSLYHLLLVMCGAKPRRKNKWIFLYFAKIWNISLLFASADLFCYFSSDAINLTIIIYSCYSIVKLFFIKIIFWLSLLPPG